MGYNTLNYTEQGGDKTVIGGEIEVTGTITLTDATVAGVVTAPVVDTLVSESTTSALSAAQGKALKDTADTLATTVAGKITASAAANQAASTEATNPTVAEFNTLLAALKTAGLMVGD
ncbi:MAG: hypothetical protein WCS15_02405 [Prevotella sp.]